MNDDLQSPSKFYVKVVNKYFHFSNLYTHKAFVRVLVIQPLLKGWIDFDEIFGVRSSGFENGLEGSESKNYISLNGGSAYKSYITL